MKKSSENKNLNTPLWSKCIKKISLLRYRFFIFAGLFPYLVGQAMAYNTSFIATYFWLGLLGILLMLIGVEFFNEYFDAKAGGDRVFSLAKIEVPHKYYPLGLSAIFLSSIIAIYLSLKVGFIILIIAFLGAIAAYFYVGTPIKLAYRGFGELVIAISYGPLMVFGSYYLQTGQFSFVAGFVSLIFALSLFALAILNEIPDFYQDRLVDKRNLVVRFGKKAGIRLFSLTSFSIFLILIIGIIFKIIPFIAAFSFLMVPFYVKSLKKIKKDYDNPKNYRAAVNTYVIFYLSFSSLLIIGYII